MSIVSSTQGLRGWMAPRPRQLPLLLLPLLLSAAVAAPSSQSSHYSFPVFDGKSTTDGVVVATNSSMLSPATFLFDAQLFPEFNQSEGFVLLSRAVALWRNNAQDGTHNEASFNTSFMVDVGGSGSAAVSFVVLLDSFPPFNSEPRATNGSALSAGAAVPSATNSLAAVEVGTVGSYGPRPPPGVGLNVTITPNYSSSANVSQLAVRIHYDASAHRLAVYVDDPRLNSTAALLDAPLDLAGRLPSQDALVGFFSATVRDVVVGVSGWELTVDPLPGHDGDEPPRPQEQSTSSSSSLLVVLVAVLGSVAAVGVAVVSVMLYRVACRRRAADMEVQNCYREYFARMTPTDPVKSSGRCS